jgi:cytochrome c oxidase cbb3-type subunit 3
MRIFFSIPAAALFLTSIGCHGTPTPTAASSFPSTSTAVGPVPGPPETGNEATNPLAGDPVALQDGRRLFDWYNCSGCHGGHAGGGMGPSLRDPVWLYGNQDAQIFSTIAEGRSNGMPAWGSKIPEHQIWELVAYIKSMRTPQEPDPPVEPADEMVPDPTGKTATSVRNPQ